MLSTRHRWSDSHDNERTDSTESCWLPGKKLNRWELLQEILVNSYMFEKKHIIVDILPRIFWLIQFASLAASQWLSDHPVGLTENVFILTLGITLTVFGSLLNAWTVSHLVRAIKTRELVQTGPYKYIRHPMYVFIYITLIGAGMLWFSSTWFIILFSFIPVWYWIGRKEEKQMDEITDGKYSDYRKRTGMFFPRL